MKFSNIQLEEFNVVEKDGLILVTPKNIGVHWNKDNLIYRSSMWDKEGNPVSLSFKKFFNWGEHYDLYNYPKTLQECSVMEKMDGSTLIISRYNGQMIYRTRGSFDLLAKWNSMEVIDFIQEENKFKLFELEKGDTWENSYIFEWYSPENRIVLDYGNKPIFWLTCVIRHNDYSYWKQNDIDQLAKEFNFQRPKRYTFSSFEELNKEIQKISNFEGVCVYYNNDQNILKIKNLGYLARHAFKSECSLKTVFDLFFSFGKPDYNTFCNVLQEKFDYECVQYTIPFIKDVCSVYDEANKIIDDLINFVEENKNLPRKEFAIKNIEKYGKGTPESNIAFTFLGNPYEQLTEDKLEKLMLSILERRKSCK